MKAYLQFCLCTLVCLGVALMLMVDTTYAVEFGVEVVISPKPGPNGYEVDEVLKVTFRPKEDGSTLAVAQSIAVVVSGAIQRTDNTGTMMLPNSFVGTTSSGELSLWIKVGKGISGTVSGLWEAGNNFQGITNIPIYAPPDPTPIYDTQLIVLPPMHCIVHDEALLSQSINFENIKTHDALLEALDPLRLRELAAHSDNAPTDDPPNTFRAPIVILNAMDLSGWQFDIAYNPQILEVVEVSSGDYAIFEGDFLKQGAVTTFFPAEISVEQAAGEIIRISQSRTQTPTGANGSGELVSICFRVKEFAEESLGLHNVQLSNSAGERLDFTTIVHPVVVTHQFPPEDVNRDTVVDVDDLMIIAASLGLANPINPRADLNNDGIVNVLDLVIVAELIGNPTPPSQVRNPNQPAPPVPGSVAALDPATIQAWINFAHVEDDGSIVFDLAIANLEVLLASKVPTETKLLLNYPNPFNPETWIPYQLAEATEVTISIYSVNGTPIRALALGYQAAGVYQNKSQAAYWDGRNEHGEHVASGVYFYTLSAGNFSATGKMLVGK